MVEQESYFNRSLYKIQQSEQIVRAMATTIQYQSKKAEMDTDDEDDGIDEDDEEMPDAIGKSYEAMTRPRETEDTHPSELIRKRTPSKFTPDGATPQRQKISDKIRRSDRNTNKPNRYGCVPIQKTFR